MAVHVARIHLMQVNSTGGIVDKNNTSIDGMLRTSTEHRVVADATIPNTAGNPTVKTYLELEEAGGFRMVYMDQNTIVTYD